MQTIDKSQALAKLKMEVAKILKVRHAVTSVFKSLFPVVESEKLGRELFITRQGKKIAAAINRNAPANINTLNKSTQKDYIPAYFDEAFFLTAEDGFYNLMSGVGSTVTMGQIESLAQSIAAHMEVIEDKIARTEELQCAQALHTGIVSAINGDSVDYNRLATSILAYDAANDWGINSVNPETLLIKAAEHIVSKSGQSPSQIFNVFMGDLVTPAFKNNPIRQSQGDIKDQVYMKLETGVTDMKGATPQGMYKAGNYTFNLWGYSGTYEDANAAEQKYLEPHSIIVLPQSPRFELFYGGIAAWSATNSDGTRSVNSLPVVKKGKRQLYAIADEKSVTMQMGIKSSPLPILGIADDVYTAQVIHSNVQLG